MSLVLNLLDTVRAHDCPVRRICVGPHWIVVESRFTGMAHRFQSHDQSEEPSTNDYTGKSAFELADCLRSGGLPESGLGVAALNSLIEPSGRPANIFSEIFRMIKGRIVTVVGRFPINREMAEVARRLYVLEMEPEAGELPAEACKEVIPQSDIVVISGSSLINKTLPHLLELCTEAKAKAFVIGPSTPMSDILLQHGAYMLGGMRVLDTEALIDSVKRGARSSKELTGIEAVVKS